MDDSPDDARHPVQPNGQRMNPLVPPPVIVAIFGAVMWGIHHALEFGKFESAWLVPVAGILLAAGLLLIILAAISFAAAGTTINPLRPSRASSLVTTGLFAISRNPIYLGDLLILAAVVVWLGNIVNAVLLPVFIGVINRFQILPEERALTALFGDGYIAYCARVRRWL